MRLVDTDVLVDILRGQSAALYTFNAKHYKAIPDLAVEPPCAR